MKAWRNGGMSIGHLEVDGMDRESPFLESGMFNEMSMGWDWWNRWVWVRSTINDSVSFKPGQWKCWVRSPINVFVMSITLRSIVTFLMPKLSNNTWVMSWLEIVRSVHEGLNYRVSLGYPLNIPLQDPSPKHIHRFQMATHTWLLCMCVFALPRKLQQVMGRVNSE